jgi:hypothetical protein
MKIGCLGPVVSLTVADNSVVNLSGTYLTFHTSGCVRSHAIPHKDLCGIVAQRALPRIGGTYSGNAVHGHTSCGCLVMQLTQSPRCIMVLHTTSLLSSPLLRLSCLRPEAQGSLTFFSCVSPEWALACHAPEQREARHTWILLGGRS